MSAQHSLERDHAPRPTISPRNPARLEELTFAQAVDGAAVYFPNGRVCEEGVSIFMAHYNTRVMSELAIRTLRLTAPREVPLVVGDSGSTDGTRETLASLREEGLVQRVDIAELPKKHWEWLDEWRANCPTRYALFVDSDVRFRQAGWLEQMLSAARTNNAAIVAAEHVPEDRDAIHDGHLRFHFAWRPSPWLLLVDLAMLDEVTVGFRDWSFETDATEHGLAAFDVGGAIAHAASACGLRVVSMQPDFRRYFVHYGGMSWRRQGKGRKMITHAVLARNLAWHLAKARWRRRGLCRVVYQDNEQRMQPERPEV